MIVLYYTTPNYLDLALETIQSIKDTVELHLIIEISPDSKNSTIINVECLDNFGDIEDCEHVLGNLEWNYLKKYFESLASAKFLISKNKRNFSYESYCVAKVLGRHIKKLKPDVIHFDTITERSLGLYPYIRSKKVFITVHDPKPHLGEISWKKRVPNLVFFRLAKGYFFYSNFACNQFKKYYPSVTTAKHIIRFQPVTYITQFLKKEKSAHETILFFGRLTPYKGIDLLLDAIPKVLEKYPEEKFIIAGSLEYDYKIDQKIIEQYKHNIKIITGYISTNELIKHIQKAKFIVCPYREATQSGVLMTAFGAGKMVIATNVGAFPEYICDNVNGMLTEPTSGAIAAKIVEVLQDDKFKTIEKNIENSYSRTINYENQQCILGAYQALN